MLKTILYRIAFTFAVIVLPLSADTTDVSWGNGEPGTLEAAITGPGVYRLEAGKVYLTIDHIPVASGAIHIVSATPEAGGAPATVQPMTNAAGEGGHTNGELFTVTGDDAELALKGLIINGAYFDQSSTLHGGASARGARNKIIVDNCIVSHIGHIAFFTMGTQTDFHITNSIVKAFTNGPGGMFYGGLIWGAGSWMGTVDTLVIQNNTIDGVIGEAIVLYEHTDHGLVDHNTFTNIAMGALWYRGQNNVTVSNNLFYNTKAYGQSTYDYSGWGVWHAGGMGQMGLQPDYDTSYTMGDGQFVNMDDRNIHYGNNAWHFSPEFRAWLTTMGSAPWSWQVSSVTADTAISGTDTTITYDTTYTTQADTMLAVVDLAKWSDDSTAKLIAQNTGVTESNNIEAPNLNMMLDPNYITTQLARTLDFRDNQSTDTAPFDTKWWQYEHDDNHVNVEWPLHMDCRYSVNSVAATHSTTGGPVGDPRWAPHSLAIDNASLPQSFELKQNYPNPFNPTTEISFTLNKTSNVNLTIFNLIGQKVRVLANGSKQAGTYRLSWDGRDEIGSAVSTGVYFYTLTDGTNTVTMKMALMK